jgi:hypothetical protein
MVLASCPWSVLVGQDAGPTVIPHKIKLGPCILTNPLPLKRQRLLVVTCHQVETVRNCAHKNRNLPLRKQILIYNIQARTTYAQYPKRPAL